MVEIEKLKKRRNDAKLLLKKINLPTDGSATRICWAIGTSLEVTGPTVLNYIGGEIKDGYLAESIYNEFKRLKMVK